MSFQIDWAEHGKLLIRDVHTKWHNSIRTFMLEHYFEPHPLYEQIDLQREKNVKNQYFQYLTHILKDECSVVAIDEKDEIHAVALVKWMTKEWRSWTILHLVVQSVKLNQLITINRNMIYNHAKEHPEETPSLDSLHVFEYFVSDELKDDAEFMSKFFHAICEVARHMKMPRVTYLAMMGEQQNQMTDAGWTEIRREVYSLYMDEGVRPFTGFRSIGEFAALYEKKVGTLMPYYDMIVHSQEEPNQQQTSLVRIKGTV